MLSTRLAQRPHARQVVSLLTIAAMVLTLVTAIGAGRAAAAGSSCHPYPDVNSSNSACENIAWLKTKDITKPADGKYHPTARVNRGSMAAFLFRLTHPGMPSPTCRSKPFPDVPTNNVFCGYIRWAKSHHIAFGYANGDYGLGKPVTRGAMAAYLRRVATNRATPKCMSKPFRDVPVSSTFCGVITWAKANGITYGVGGSKYGTAAPVTRQAMASFLHRVAKYDPKHDRIATVTTVTPFAKDGRVKFPLGDSEYAWPPGWCVRSPLAFGAGVYQCGMDHMGACWADPAGSPYMYCLDDADDTTVMRADRPSNLPTIHGSLTAMPWELVLDDGTVCDAWFNDTSISPDGWYKSYICSGTYLAVAGKGFRPKVDTSTWTTQAVKNDSSDNNVYTVHVKHAYYAGAEPHVPPAKSGSACPSASVLEHALGAGFSVSPGGIRCVGDWATSGYSDGFNAGAALYHRSGGVWLESNRTTACELPSPVPAALYQTGCMVS